MLQCNASKCSWRAHFCDPQPSSFQQEQYWMFINNIHIFLSGICQWQCLAVTVIGVHLWQWLAVALICVHQWQWQVFVSDRYLAMTVWRLSASDMCLAITFRCVCVCEVFVRQVFFALVGVNSLSVLDRCLCHEFAYQCQTGVCVGHSATMLDMFVSDMSGHMFACQACLSMSGRQWVQRDVKDVEMLSGDTSYEITTAHRCCNVCHSCKRNVYFCDETLNAFDGKRLLLHFIQHLWGELFDMNFPFWDNCFHGWSFCFFDCGLRSRRSKLPNWLLTKAVVPSSCQQQQQQKEQKRWVLFSLNLE